MIRFLLSVAISLVSAALALLVAAWLIDGVTVQTTGFVVAVVVFSVAQGLLGPFVFNVARKYASAVLGGIGLVSTVLALFVATLFPDGLRIQGLTAWIVTPLVVWLITALGTWILGALIIQRWWERRQQRSSAPARD
ncbi:MAG TPA: phage holin family protein [Microlunatus sp.]|nr:phage holin family protein [Microlunatus sp.]